jgi:hypothetical protein
MPEQSHDLYDQAAQQTVELANRLADQDREADPWEVADGILSGAVHYWLYTRQPCADPRCEDCADIATGDARLVELLRAVEAQARASDYFHSINDRNVGRA